MEPPTCHRCQRHAHEIQHDDEASLWKVKWNHATEETILCGECLDILDEYAKQQTGHPINYEAPEAVGEPCPGYHDLGCDNPTTHEGLCEECFQHNK